MLDMHLINIAKIELSMKFWMAINTKWMLYTTDTSVNDNHVVYVV